MSDVRRERDGNGSERAEEEWVRGGSMGDKSREEEGKDRRMKGQTRRHPGERVRGESCLSHRRRAGPSCRHCPLYLTPHIDAAKITSALQGSIRV